MRSNFMFAKGKNIDIVTQAELVEPYVALRDDLVRTTYAAYMAELMDGLTADADRDLAKYDLLSKALGWLGESDNSLLVARYYELRLLSLAGFQTAAVPLRLLSRTHRRARSILQRRIGRAVVPCLPRGRPWSPAISSSAVKVLRHLQSHKWEYVKDLRLRGKLRHELESAMHFNLSHILGAQLEVGRVLVSSAA